MRESIEILRKLKAALCPDGMVSLQAGGVGNLPLTEFNESRITFLQDGAFQYVTVTDDEWDNPERLIAEVQEMILTQRKENK